MGERRGKETQELSIAVGQSIDGIAVGDLEAKLTYVNEAFARMHGYSARELIGKEVAILHNKEQMDDFKKGIHKIKTQGSWKGEIGHIKKDGTPFPTYMSVTLSKDDQAKPMGILVVCRDIAEQKETEEALKKKTHDLGERVKELSCLYGISSLIEKPRISLREIFQGVVNLIPPAWQYPDITCARIILEEQTFKTKNYQETVWKQTSDIVVDGKRVGAVEVCYLKERPESDEGPFLKEERNLLDAITERLGRIVERITVEEELISSEERLKILFEFAPDGIYLNDLRGTFVDGNKATERLTGYKREELIGKSFLKLGLLPLKQIPKAAALLARNALGRSTGPDEFILNRKDGERVIVEINTYPVNVRGESFVLGIARDITEHRRKEKEIERRVKEWDRTFNAIRDFVFIQDKNFRFIRVNKSFADVLKLKPEDLIGKTCYETLHKSDKPWSNCPFAKTIKDGKTHAEEVEDPNVGLPLLITTSPIFDEKGELVGGVHIARDITERKEAEEALIQSEKLKALGEMAGGVAHDFNNLLAIILGNAQLLERALGRYSQEEIKKRLRTIAQTAYEGGETVRRMQYFTHRGVLPQDFTEINLDEIIREAIASTSPCWKDEAESKGITIRIRRELGKLPLLSGNRSELMEVLTNLIFNAVEAMPQGGEIIIKTEAREEDVFLYFTDTGQGIPHKIKNKIFDPFFTTKGPKASGLGLSVSYGIIKHHQGEIKVDAIKGKGTTFAIRMPVPLEIPSEKKKLRKPQKIPSRKILVIDDEEGVRDVLGRIFEDEGHRVLLAESAREGLERFKEDNFNLVLTDLGMPEMSGWELARKIKKIDPSMPVGLITGWAATITEEKMKEQRVDLILSKPFDYAKVIREVNTLLKSKKR